MKIVMLLKIIFGQNFKMKKILFVLTLFLSVSVFCQEMVQTKESASKEFDVAAEYEGGITKFREAFQKHFDSKNEFKGNGTYQTLITFIVDENGSISQIFATGKNDSFNTSAINAIKKIKGKWTSALLNGNPVKSRYKFPLTMTYH